jgi:uncharacterized integral membrane protein
LRFYFDLAVQAPLVAVLLAAFALGALFGMLALSGTLLRQRREIAKIKTRDKIERAIPPAAPPI